jgi:hypothetical protein
MGGGGGGLDIGVANHTLGRAPLSSPSTAFRSLLTVTNALHTFFPFPPRCRNYPNCAFHPWIGVIDLCGWLAAWLIGWLVGWLVGIVCLVG